MRRITRVIHSGPLFVGPAADNGQRGYVVSHPSSEGRDTLPGLPRRTEQALRKTGHLPLTAGETITLVEETVLRDYEFGPIKRSAVRPEAVYVIDSRGVVRLPLRTRWTRIALPAALCALVLLLALRISK